tara:strand:- start:1544 stop:1666 length:123 start_codon:yes stop_codon:yes gene_type:complete
VIALETFIGVLLTGVTGAVMSGEVKRPSFTGRYGFLSPNF